MRIVSDHTTEVWKSPDKTGPDRRPVARATVQRFGQRLHRYDTSDMQGEVPIKRLHLRGYFQSALFGDAGGLREISNISKLDWSRATSQDVAEATLTLENVELQPIGSAPRGGAEDDYDNPGAMTPTRGTALDDSNRWGFSGDPGWSGMIVPDRMIKTYEGYGSDPDVAPAQDPHLKQSGCWIIDECTYTAAGDITVKMRDLGRLLLDTIVFPPAVPFATYPLTFSATRNVTGYRRKLAGGSYKVPTGTRVTSSNQYFKGKGIQTDDGTTYIAGDGSVMGHRETDTLTMGDGSYWMSTGLPDQNKLAWLQFNFANPTNIAGVQVAAAYGPYRVYLSVRDEHGNWLGKKLLPAQKVQLAKPGGGTYGAIDMHTRIPFLRTLVVEGNYMADGGIYGDHGYIPDSSANQTTDISLLGIEKATAVRLTFKRGHSFGFDQLHPKRFTIDGVKVYTGPKSTLSNTKQKFTYQMGDYTDWTDVVRWMLGWGGWFWPEHATTEDFWAVSPTENETISYVSADPVLPRGALWADLMNAGTGGVTDLTVADLDKKPFMDVINNVRDILGFISFIDETGAFVFRMPNYWKLGNYLAPDDQDPRNGRSHTTDYVTIDEEETLLDYQLTLSSDSNREYVFVGDAAGKLGYTARGYTGFPVQLRRVAGWTDQNFTSDAEVRIAADMIVTQQMFAYRTAQVTIPGYPAIQLDDQVRIYEKMTDEHFFHYVQGISSSLDMKAGTWTYTLQTHWLGEDANSETEWVVHPSKLDFVTQQYLQELGMA